MKSPSIWLLAAIVAFFSAPGLPCERSDYPHWRDMDQDGCDTRCEVLTRDSLVPVTKKGDRVTGGLWVDPYTGQVYDRAYQMTVDHVLAICEADQAGADKWSKAKRVRFANDQDNLISTGRRSNSSKGARGEAEWMPANVSHWGRYLSTRQTIRDRYGLPVTYREQDRIIQLAEFYATHRNGLRGAPIEKGWFDWLVEFF